MVTHTFLHSNWRFGVSRLHGMRYNMVWCLPRLAGQHVQKWWICQAVIFHNSCFTSFTIIITIIFSSLRVWNKKQTLHRRPVQLGSQHCCGVDKHASPYTSVRTESMLRKSTARNLSGSLFTWCRFSFGRLMKRFIESPTDMQFLGPIPKCWKQNIQYIRQYMQCVLQWSLK